MHINLLGTFDTLVNVLVQTSSVKQLASKLVEYKNIILLCIRKHYLQVATAQDDVTGDGTTSNVLIIGELLKQADNYIQEVCPISFFFVYTSCY